MLIEEVGIQGMLKKLEKKAAGGGLFNKRNCQTFFTVQEMNEKFLQPI